MKNHFYFVGIGGAGMSGIAKVLLEMGYRVSGSDLKDTETTQRLRKLGAHIYIGHDSQNVGEDVDALIISSAIPQDNPELLHAKSRGIPVMQRAQMLGQLMKDRFGIAVAGTHGKTTTTSMISFIFDQSGFDPTFIIGGEVNDIGGNAKLGTGNHLIAEADESDGSLLNLCPRSAAITNIEAEHLDFYGDLEKIMDTFQKFIAKIPAEGYVALGVYNENICKLLNYMKGNCKFITYGFAPNAEISASNIRLFNGTAQFALKYNGNEMMNVLLNVPGEHNVLNALAAIAISMESGIDLRKIRKALFDFKGVQRRFQIIGEPNGVMIVDDYAHHPTEIIATLKTAKAGWGREVIAVFQPHRYTRTKFLAEDFGKAFSLADHIIITDIYSAGEPPIPGVHAEQIAELVRKNEPHKPVEFISPKELITTHLAKISKPGVMVMTIGAGDICTVACSLRDRLKGKEKTDG